MSNEILTNVIVVTLGARSKDSIVFAYNHLRNNGYAPFWVRYKKDYFVCRYPGMDEMDNFEFVNQCVQDFEGEVLDDDVS